MEVLGVLGEFEESDDLDASGDLFIPKFFPHHDAPFDPEGGFVPDSLVASFEFADL